MDPSSSLDLDAVISSIDSGELIDEQTAFSILIKLMEVFYSEPNVLELTSPITIVGDIHGQLYDLFELFEHTGPKTGQKFLFMGDYVDRGYYSLETFCYLASLKLKHPDQIFLLRGNHESRKTNQMYGFYAEIIYRFGHSGLWSLCNNVFDLLPFSALIDNHVFSIHGGLSPDIPLIETISSFNRNDEIPDSGPLADLCWSDPDFIKGWLPNTRGTGHSFGAAPTKEFCYNNRIDFITRSHQLVKAGYQWFFDEKLVTIWSAPNYMYRSGNIASIMKYHPKNPNPTGEPYDIITFAARDANRRKIPEESPVNNYFI